MASIILMVLLIGLAGASIAYTAQQKGRILSTSGKIPKRRIND
jgi:hypothetical protein